MVFTLKAVIDTGTMITLSSTCLMNVFKSLVEANKIELMVSSTIEQESVFTPLGNKRFALNAARIKHALADKTVKVIPPDSRIANEQQKILELANSCFSSRDGNVVIIQKGEAEALALARIYGAKALFIDERTTRSLIENPARLKEVLERRQGQSMSMNGEAVNEFREMFSELRVFRSVDLIALAYEQNLFDHELEHGKLELEAALWAAKFSGCAVSEKEITQYLTAQK